MAEGPAGEGPVSTTRESTEEEGGGPTGGPGSTSGSDGDDDDSSTGGSACRGNAEYELTLESDWDDPDLPSGPLLSPSTGAVHEVGYSAWRLGDLASPGLEELAENGQGGDFHMEISYGIFAGTVHELISIPGFSSPGSDSTTFTAEPDHSAVTVATRLHPTPDWFIGLDGFDLCSADGWIETVSIPATIYDAGTEDGNDFTPNGAATIPPEPISIRRLRPVATWTFNRTAP